MSRAPSDMYFDSVVQPEHEGWLLPILFANVLPTIVENCGAKSSRAVS